MPSDPGDVRPRTSALSVYSTRETTRAWTPFAKRHGVSEQTIYSWRKRYGEFDVADVRRLCELEQENARLKKMVAERDLEINVMKEIAKKTW